jgi:hypothetical protein
VANDLTSNITRKVLRSFLKGFVSNKVVTKTVDTQIFSGKFNPASGSTVDIKRPHDYTTIRTSGGDISSSQKDDIISGKATATVQPFITAAVEWDIIEEAIELDQLDQILMPMGRRMITDLEVDFASFMMKNTGMVQGTPGEAIDTWSEVANAGALMASTGVPSDMPWYYLMNPFSQVAMANLQNALTSVDTLVQTAWEKAQISRDFGGMQALTANALASYTNPAIADRAGVLESAPDPTYVTAKDTMTQVISIDGLTAAVTIVAGSVLEVPTRFILNQSTREPALDADGNNIPWRGVVQADVLTDATADLFTVSSPAIFDSGTENPQYNTVVAALTTSDVINVISPSAATVQPNLFYHPQAFSLTTVRLPKLFSTDTTSTSEDGFSLRVSKYSDGDANRQKVRIDLLPAFAVLNPYFAGQGHGVA